MKVAIIGAGAAGCFTAANIPYTEGIEVAVFEKTGKALQKVKVSGGGRCNVTHDCFEVTELLTRYPRGKQLLKKTLYQFGPQQTVDWFTARGVRLKTEGDGRMFPITDDSQTIIDCIWQEMMRNKANIYYHKGVSNISRVDGSSQLTLHFADNTSYVADKVVIGTGGFPKADQYKWLEALGHTIQPPVPSLFTFNMPGNPITALMGVSVPDAVVKISGTKIVTQGPLLITHWGMSGPAALKASAFGARELANKQYDFQVMVNWLGGMSDADVKESIAQLRREQGKQLIHSRSPFDLPRRLWEFFLQEIGVKEDTRWGELQAGAQNKLVERLVRDIYHVKGKTTFKDEFVTCGGINLNEVNAATMESRVVPGLYFAGEILDVDGITGGYNFQNAWSGAWVVAQSILSSK